MNAMTAAANLNPTTGFDKAHPVNLITRNGQKFGLTITEAMELLGDLQAAVRTALAVAAAKGEK